LKREREREVDEEQGRRERVVSCVRESMERGGAVDLVDVAWKEGKDRVWVERLVRASGLLGQLQSQSLGGEKDKAQVMITESGWLVRLDEELMQSVYRDVEMFGERHGGKVGYDQFAGVLEKAVLARAKA
jgi:hypothetical protein